MLVLEQFVLQGDEPVFHTQHASVLHAREGVDGVVALNDGEYRLGVVFHARPNVLVGRPQSDGLVHLLLRLDEWPFHLSVVPQYRGFDVASLDQFQSQDVPQGMHVGVQILNPFHLSIECEVVLFALPTDE